MLGQVGQRNVAAIVRLGRVCIYAIPTHRNDLRHEISDACNLAWVAMEALVKFPDAQKISSNHVTHPGIIV